MLGTQLLAIQKSNKNKAFTKEEMDPPSGLTATSVLRILLNNIQFMHLPVILNLSHWNMAEFGHCVKTNVSLLYAHFY